MKLIDHILVKPEFQEPLYKPKLLKSPTDTEKSILEIMLPKPKIKIVNKFGK